MPAKDAALWITLSLRRGVGVKIEERKKRRYHYDCEYRRRQLEVHKRTYRQKASNREWLTNLVAKQRARRHKRRITQPNFAEKGMEAWRRRRASMLNQLGKVSPDIKAKLLEVQGYKCPYCKADLRQAKPHLDHIMPLALGGLHDDSNLQVLCAFCNLSKHDKHLAEFARENEYRL